MYATSLGIRGGLKSRRRRARPDGESGKPAHANARNIVPSYVLSYVEEIACIDPICLLGMYSTWYRKLLRSIEFSWSHIYSTP